MYPEVLSLMVEDLFESCANNKLTLAVAESCTGGLIGGLITSVAGSSDVFDRGFITYTNAAKSEMLGVKAEVFEQFGAVSEPCARAMALGAIEHSDANLSASVTGIAGPGGGTEFSPVGRVHICVARAGFDPIHEQHTFSGERERVRIQAVESVLRLLNQVASKDTPE